MSPKRTFERFISSQGVHSCALRKSHIRVYTRKQYARIRWRKSKLEDYWLKPVYQRCSVEEIAFRYFFCRKNTCRLFFPVVVPLSSALDRGILVVCSKVFAAAWLSLFFLKRTLV